MAIDAIATRADLAFLEQTKPDPKRVDRYLTDLRKLSPMPDVASKINLCERFMTLESVRLIDEQGLRDFERLSGASEESMGTKILTEIALVGIDWDPALIEINGWFDRLETILKEKNHAMRSEKLEELEKDLKALKAKASNPWTMAALPLAGGKEKGRLLGEIMVCLLMPALQKVEQAYERSRQTESNLHIAFALAAYHSDEKHYPKVLAELAPKYLKEIPLDQFSGKALIYRPQADGYVLYSVGPNGQDEGGRNVESEPRGDDIGITMPLPAKEAMSRQWHANRNHRSSCYTMLESYPESLVHCLTKKRVGKNLGAMPTQA